MTDTAQAFHYLSARDVCERLGVTEKTLYRWIKAGRLTVYRLPNGRRRFALEEVRSLVDGPAA